MSCPVTRYLGEEGESSARYRPADQKPERSTSKHPLAKEREMLLRTRCPETLPQIRSAPDNSR